MKVHLNCLTCSATALNKQEPSLAMGFLWSFFAGKNAFSVLYDVLCVFTCLDFLPMARWSFIGPPGARLLPLDLTNGVFCAKDSPTYSYLPDTVIAPLNMPGWAFQWISVLSLGKISFYAASAVTLKFRRKITKIDVINRLSRPNFFASMTTCLLLSMRKTNTERGGKQTHAL